MLTRCLFLILTSIISCQSYKISPGVPVPPVPGLRYSPFVYRGPVFIIQETDDINEPFIGHIVEGGIELVQQHLKTLTKSHLHDTFGLNDTLHDIQEDPEYFTVLVTPETVAQAQISRTTTISIPLSLLLLGVSARIPWVMVLKRKNHYEYFRNFVPYQVFHSQRRRTRSLNFQEGRLFTENKKYDMIYTEDDKNTIHQICTDIIEDLVHLNTFLQHQGSNVDDIFNIDNLFDLNNGTKYSSVTKLNRNQSPLKQEIFVPTADTNLNNTIVKIKESLNKTDRENLDNNYTLKILMNN